ncbi:retinol dehydrogenase 11-like [Epargyreus clarus]|uniref:retinol dehydrogenase 11-like n=1 Tax=Epargyreus clarus TaxID=520877 RepID=UPI003C2C5C87
MFAVLYIIVTTVVVAVMVGLYQKNTNAMCKSKRRLDGKTVIITGGTSGMGLRIAVDFADRGARVIVACPFVDEGVEGRKIIIDKTGNENVVFKLLDLSTLDSVRKFAADIIRTESRLDILINNAGVGNVDDCITADGMSFIMQVNYFGHFLLTLLLLPMMKNSGRLSDPSRIVNTSSVLHTIGKLDIDKLNSVDYWYPTQVYGNSKLCLILFAHELSKKIKGSNIVINTVDPGAVGTTIFNCAGKFVGAFCTFFFRNIFKTPWEGAQTAIHVALDKKAGEVSGQYFKNCKVSRARRAAYNEKLSARLWDESLKFVKLNNEDVDQFLMN